ncbi:MAG TPA: pantetheine-phosphate adenylyltransferase [Alphaproteobacteria bacterium]|nr:pantetheine-phosphate adenylyltransferase [Alphaproteobacteria bacterium]
MAERIGVYPGTFDPITNGHLDIILRASRIVDRVIVAIAINDGKGPLFSLDERIRMVEEECAKLAKAGNPALRRVRARAFDNLLMHFVRQMGANVIIRGLRAVSDFDYEFQMAGMNARVDPEVETVFLMASERQTFISSRFVKEIARLGGDISSFVPAGVARRLVARFKTDGPETAARSTGLRRRRNSPNPK